MSLSSLHEPPESETLESSKGRSLNLSQTEEIKILDGSHESDLNAHFFSYPLVLMLQLLLV